MLSVLINLTQTQLLLALPTLNLAFGLGWAKLASSTWDAMRTKHTNKPPLLQELKNLFLDSSFVVYLETFSPRGKKYTTLQTTLMPQVTAHSVIFGSKE
jgi:hypothetical protein